MSLLDCCIFGLQNWCRCQRRRLFASECASISRCFPFLNPWSSRRNWTGLRNRWRTLPRFPVAIVAVWYLHLRILSIAFCTDFATKVVPHASKARLETALAKEVTLRTSNQSCMISMLQLPWSLGWIQQRDRVRQRSSWKNCQRQTTHVRKTFPSHFCKQGKIHCYIAFNQKKLIHGIPFCFSPRATDFNFCIRLRSIPSWLRAGWQMLSQIISVAACHCSVLLVTGHLLLAGIKMDCEVCN